MATALLSAAPAAPGARSARAQRSGFRRDIEGLRAIAVLAVLIYHLRTSLLPGGFIGVDIFFVISGFLITSHLVKEQVATGTISLRRFYARRALRLIPAATLVLLATTVATILFVPRVLWQQFGGAVAAAATYVINWVLAGQSVDYLAEDTVASPAQHFWSLAVEEQFYLIWPLLIIVTALVARRLGRRVVPALGAAGGLVLVVSLVWALIAAQRHDASGYFTTTTRLWELAVGAIAAIAFPWLRDRMTRVVSTTLVTVGAIALVASLILIRDENLWPSALTVVPVVATGLILVGGRGGSSAQGSYAERMLSIAPLVWVGGISYALYLWHWPLITIARYVRPNLRLWELVLIAAVAVLLAWLTQLIVENPVRFSRRMRSRSRHGLILGLACALVAAGAGLGLAAAGPEKVLAPPSNGSTAASATGAGVLSDDITSTPVKTLTATPKWVLPQPMSAPQDLPAPYADRCGQNATDPAIVSCTYGDKKAKRVIATIGDSKMEQWFSALDAIAKSHGYRLVTFYKSTCSFAGVPVVVAAKPFPSCDAWNAAVIAEIAKLKPEVVLTSQVHATALVKGSSSVEAQSAAMVDGLVDTYGAFRSHGITVGIVGDNPPPPASARVYQCVATHPTAPGKCDFPRRVSPSASVLRSVVKRAGGSFIDASSRLVRGADRRLVFVDMSDAICPPQLGRCPSVIGNTMVYRQGSHLTDTYIRSLTDRLDGVLTAAGVVE